MRNLIDINYYELFSSGINSSYFTYFDLLNTEENNFMINNYIKNLQKIILSVICSFLKGASKTMSFRLKNRYGTIHFNIKPKSLGFVNW